MKCPQCTELGLRSVVRWSDTASMEVRRSNDRFYDEDGKLHHHTDAWHVLYFCTQGHRWEARERTKCSSCDWAAR